MERPHENKSPLPKCPTAGDNPAWASPSHAYDPVQVGINRSLPALESSGLLRKLRAQRLPEHLQRLLSDKLLQAEEERLKLDDDARCAQKSVAQVVHVLRGAADRSQSAEPAEDVRRLLDQLDTDCNELLKQCNATRKADTRLKVLERELLKKVESAVEIMGELFRRLDISVPVASESSDAFSEDSAPSQDSMDSNTAKYFDLEKETQELNESLSALVQGHAEALDERQFAFDQDENLSITDADFVQEFENRRHALQQQISGKISEAQRAKAVCTSDGINVEEARWRDLEAAELEPRTELDMRYWLQDVPETDFELAEQVSPNAGEPAGSIERTVLEPSASVIQYRLPEQHSTKPLPNRYELPLPQTGSHEHGNCSAEHRPGMQPSAGSIPLSSTALPQHLAASLWYPSARTTRFDIPSSVSHTGTVAKDKYGLGTHQSLLSRPAAMSGVTHQPPSTDRQKGSLRTFHRRMRADLCQTFARRNAPKSFLWSAKSVKDQRATQQRALIFLRSSR